MAYRVAEADIKRAKELRQQARTVRNGDAKAAFEAAADRLEAQAARKARRIGRRQRKRKKVIL